MKFANGNIPLFKGGQNENLKTFLKDYKKTCIFGIIGTHTQKWRVNFFSKIVGNENFDMV